MDVEVSCYKAPYGYVGDNTVSVSDDLAEKWQQIVGNNCRITVEELPIGHTSLCIEERDLGDYVIEFHPFEVDAVVAIERIIEGFDLEDFKKFVEAYSTQEL